MNRVNRLPLLAPAGYSPGGRTFNVDGHPPVDIVALALRAIVRHAGPVAGSLLAGTPRTAWWPLHRLPTSPSSPTYGRTA
jgi:hypothetical protein